MIQRTFEFSEGTSNKFWTITLDGKSHTVVFGRIGTPGQSQTKEFASDAEAEKSYSKLVAEKTRKGYVEVTTGAAPAVAAAASKPAPRPAPVKAAPPPPDAMAPVSALPPPPAPTTPPSAQPPPVPSSVAPIATPSVPAAPARTSAPGPAPEPMTPRRVIDLDPHDVPLANGDGAALPPLAPAEPFDQAACVARFLSTVKVRMYGWDWDFSEAVPDRQLEPAEAEFWLTAMTLERDNKTTLESTAEKLRTLEFTGVMPRKLKLIQRFVWIGPKVVPCLAALLSPEALCELVLDPKTAQGDSLWENKSSVLREGFWRYVLPHMSAEARARWRETLRARWDPAAWPMDFYQAPPPVFFFGPLFGLEAEARALVESWPDDRYRASDWDHTAYHRPQEIVFGLGSGELVAHHFRRLKLPLTSDSRISTFLALTGVSALDVVAASIASTGRREDAEERFAGFARVHAPEAAPHALDLALNSKAPKLAREWLERHPVETVTGLLPVAAGTGKLAAAAVDYLRSLKRRGHAELIAGQLALVSPEVAARVRAVVLDAEEVSHPTMTAEETPAWWREALQAAPIKKKTAPGWAVVTDLPQIVADGRAFSPQHLGELFAALQAGTPEAPHPLVRALREHGPAEGLDAFAWRLFELWLQDGGASKDKWAFQALGCFGGDRTVLKLAPLIRAWPGESQHPRAVAGLDILRAIGTDAALMQINGIAQKVKFKGLKERAVQCMDAIAEARGMSRAQLEDRIVPDCDLDERGSRVFDFGPRQFRFVLGADMKPMIRYPDGATKPDLPKPGAKDDAAKAEAAVAEWKLLKKQIAEIAKIQAVRLEQAMVTGRRWSGEEFERLLVRHPLMINLVRLLVWGAYGANGQIGATFRVTEDQTLANAGDEPFDLPAEASVGIVHPLQLQAQTQLLEQWGQLFGDYEIVPPFAQLGRPTYALTTEQRGGTEITHFASRGKLPAQTLVFGLEKLGWQRAVPQDGGSVWEHSKPFYGANITAVVNYKDGFSVGYWEGAGDQTIERVFFVPGLYTPRMYPDHKNALPLAGIDPIALSEVINDFESLLAKVK